MRKKNRELTREQTLEVLSRCDTCRIALFDETAPYILPLSFGFCEEDGKMVLYFHCAAEGKKLTLLTKDPRVGFEADTGHRIIEGENACDFTTAYESVIGTGTITPVEGREQKRHGLSVLMDHYSDRRDFTFPDARVDLVTVLRLEVAELSGKRLARP